MHDLIEKFLNRSISVNERKRLKKWVLSHKDNLDIFKRAVKNRAKNNLYHQFDGKQAFEEFLSTINKDGNRKRKNLRFLRYAAFFIGLLATGSFVYITLPDNGAKIETIVSDNASDTNQITITLADGSKQVIASNGQGVITNKDGKTVARKQQQGLDFRNVTDTSHENLVFNEIYVPYGQTFNLTLSDGTKVWLNAGTRLRFPQHLKNSTQNRIVYLDGEAFFDVTKDAKRPFIVNAENLDIEVLGTQFNVSAYKSDGQIATTLVEGAVNVYEDSNPDTKVLLNPSYQAAFVKEKGTLTKEKVDTRIYTGWMENRLVIDNLSFKQIIAKLERTHNVSIINQVESLNNEVYMGEFESERIETVLKVIASSTPFTYTIENNVITISK